MDGIRAEQLYCSWQYVCAPSKVQCLKWVKDCWSSLSTESIHKSFCSCGISVNLDGSEDAEIYWLRLVKLLPLTDPAFTDFTCKLLQEDESDEEDPFVSVDEEDDRELE